MAASRSQQRHPRRLSFRKEIGIIKGRESICSPLPDEQTHTGAILMSQSEVLSLCDLVWENGFPLVTIHVKGERDGRIHQCNGKASSRYRLSTWLIQNAQMKHGKLYPDSSFFKTKLFFVQVFPQCTCVAYLCVWAYVYMCGQMSQWGYLISCAISH